MFNLRRAQRGLIATLAVLTLITGFGVVGNVAIAEPAHALGGGKVTLHKSSTGNLKISAGLVKRNGKYVMLSPIGWLAPGQNSVNTAKFKDTDAFLPPSNCVTSINSGGRRLVLQAGVVVKIQNFTHIIVTVKSCK